MIKLYWRTLLFSLYIYGVAFPALIMLVPIIFFPLKILKWVPYYWTQWAAIILRQTVKIKHQIKGQQFIQNRPVIYAMKHQSVWETLIPNHILPFPAYILKKELILLPIFGWYLYFLKMLPINRKKGTQELKKLIECTRQRLQQGRSIIIFPEGTRVSPGEQGTYQRGIAFLYEKLNVPVVPVALNSGLYWPKHKFLKLPGTITLEFLPPIPPGLPKKEFMEKLTDAIETKSLELIKKGEDSKKPSPQLSTE